MILSIILAVLAGQPPSHLQPPNPLDGFAITGTKVFPDSVLGTSYRYTKSGEPIFDVYIYPRQQSAQDEANTFVTSLPLLQQRGYFDDYRVAFNEPDTTHVASNMLIGSVVAVAVKRQGVVGLSFFYAYALPDAMVKVRVDITMAQLKTSNVPGFVHDLVGHLATP